MKRFLFFTLLFFLATNILAKDPAAQLSQLLDDYHKRLLTTPLAPDARRLQKFVTGPTAPYAYLYEPKDLYRWLLFDKCYYKWDADTFSTTIDLDVDYQPIDDHFSMLPAYFTLGTRRPSYTLDSYKNMWITVFKSVGTNIVVLINKTDNRYGYPGYEYCQSCIYSGTKMVIHCNFVLVDNVACAIYYLTSDACYNNYLYKLCFELVLSALKFKPFTTVQATQPEPPVSFSVRQNYPNPFNAMTKIAYSVSDPGIVTLELFNICGDLMKTVFQEFHQPGHYSVDVDGAGFSSGVYFYRLSNGADWQTHRMVVIR